MTEITQIDWLEELRWMDMTEGQRSIYMEFYAPIPENNIKRMPENEELINYHHFTPIQEHIDAFSNWDGTINDTGQDLTRQASYIHETLSDGQKNAIILWLSDVEGEEGGEEINDW